MGFCLGVFALNCCCGGDSSDVDRDGMGDLSFRVTDARIYPLLLLILSSKWTHPSYHRQNDDA
jgi:hypothetical protein